MRDTPITTDQAAHWLNTNGDEIADLLRRGQILPYVGKDADADKPISLNSVVILAESLPPERGIFQVREARDGGHEGAGSPFPRPSAGPGPGMRSSARPVIVERRPVRSFNRPS